MNNEYQTLIRKLQDHTALVAVIGLGYVGLPLATAFAEAGFTVTGIDKDESKVQDINRGVSYIQDVTSEQVSRLVAAGKLRATENFEALKNIDAVSICVPTPLRKTRDPDLSYIVEVAEQMARYIHPSMVVVLESTTYPGTTRELMLPKLTKGSGLTVGQDFFLAFSPERVDPGRTDWTTINTPKVVGGVTETCTDVAKTWYEQALKKVVMVSSAEVAEMTKLLENTFRMVNIGLVNEMAMMCDRLEIDVWEVIEAANTKPFGFMKFTPGPGLGGHCIPIDPLYLSWKLRSLNYTARFIELASEINTSMPRYVVAKVQHALNERGKPLKGSNILVIGAAYKPNIDDLRESPALDVIGLLLQHRASVSYHDPFIQRIKHDDWELTGIVDYIAGAKAADCVVIITDHKTYDYEGILEAADIIVDTRNALDLAGKHHPKVVKL
ncbi:MAG: nucleotide sugar dehydrogenase [Chloroflexota bacterium]